MKTITPTNLANILELHELWTGNKNGGQHADLSGADLSMIRGANVAACHWTGHGERGRTLNAVQIGKEIRFFCGCFQGDEQQLRTYIAAHNPEHISSRTKALEFLLSCF